MIPKKLNATWLVRITTIMWAIKCGKRVKIEETEVAPS